MKWAAIWKFIPRPLKAMFLKILTICLVVIFEWVERAEEWASDKFEEYHG